MNYLSFLEARDLCALSATARNFDAAIDPVGNFDDSLPIVDVRSEAEYLCGHLARSSSFPFETIHYRMHELPPKKAGSVVVVVSRRQLAKVAAFFVKRTWPVHCFVVAESPTWETTRESGKLETGNISRRLWSPSPTLDNSIAAIEKSLLGQQKSPSTNCALDIGCGRGRDCIFLGLRGWDVLGLDNKPCFVRDLNLFSSRQGLSQSVKGVLCNLKPGGVKHGGHGVCRDGDFSAIDQLFVEHNIKLINIARFYYRPLILLMQRRMPPGSYIVLHHFFSTDGAVNGTQGTNIQGTKGTSQGSNGSHATSRTGNHIKADRDSTLFIAELREDFAQGERSFRCGYPRYPQDLSVIQDKFGP
jgi:SAM-dependent methyltransferase